MQPMSIKLTSCVFTFIAVGLASANKLPSESHFTEMKYGWINGNASPAPDNNLRWFVGGQSKWNVDWVPDVWHNFAYDINFGSGTVTLWHSTGSAALTQVAGPFTASTSTVSVLHY